MARYEEIVDFWWTDDGDMSLGDDGDIKDTKRSALRGFLQMLKERVTSQRMLGFAGMPNTRETAEGIKQILRADLSVGDLMRGSEFDLDIVPISNYGIMILLAVNPPRTSGQVMLAFTYDLRDNKIIPRNV